VSYVFAGPKGHDLPRAMEQLCSVFGLKKLLLEGGGKINGAFLNRSLRLQRRKQPDTSNIQPG
jgi:riboflavin biosynthesis pyrimidine reductase